MAVTVNYGKPLLGDGPYQVFRNADLRKPKVEVVIKQVYYLVDRKLLVIFAFYSLYFCSFNFPRLVFWKNLMWPITSNNGLPYTERK